MGKRKDKDGWQKFDNFDDFMDAVRKNAVASEGEGADATPEVAKISLRDFIVPDKVSAFVRAYAPAPPGMDDTSEYVESFDDERLRQFFKAYVCGLGDPLALYVEDLKMAVFQMQVSLGTGEPCIFAIRKG